MFISRLDRFETAESDLPSYYIVIGFDDIAVEAQVPRIGNSRPPGKFITVNAKPFSLGVRLMVHSRQYGVGSTRVAT